MTESYRPMDALLGHLRAYDALWVQRRRALDTAGVFTLLVAKAGRLGSMADAQDDVDLRAAPHSPCAAHVTPGAVTRALRRLPLDAFTTIHHNLVHHAYEQPLMANTHHDGHPVYLAVDGCKIRVPPSFRRHGYGGCNKKGTGPYLLLTTAVDVTNDVIVACDISNSLNERAALLRLVTSQRIPPHSCLIADRGYFSIDVWRALHHHNVKAVLRLKRRACTDTNVALATPHRLTPSVIEDIPSRIAVWSATHDHRVHGALPPQPPLWCDHHAATQPPSTPLERDITKHDWVLITNTTLAVQHLVALYRLRWRVETVFRTLQSTFGAGLNRGGLHAVHHTITAACLLHLVSRLMDVRTTYTQRVHLISTQQHAPHKPWARPARKHRRTILEQLTPALRYQPATPQHNHDTTAPPQAPSISDHRALYVLHSLITRYPALRYSLSASAILAEAQLLQPPPNRITFVPPGIIY